MKEALLGFRKLIGLIACVVAVCLVPDAWGGVAALYGAFVGGNAAEHMAAARKLLVGDKP